MKWEVGQAETHFFNQVKMKKQIPARVEESTINALKIQAKTENRTFSNHVDTVLTKHVSKQEVKASKKEYGK